MILIMIRLLEVYFRVVCGQFEKFPIQMTPYIFGDYLMSVFGRKDNVVITEVNTMIVSPIFF